MHPLYPDEGVLRFAFERLPLLPDVPIASFYMAAAVSSIENLAKVLIDLFECYFQICGELLSTFFSRLGAILGYI